MSANWQILFGYIWMTEYWLMSLYFKEYVIYRKILYV